MTAGLTDGLGMSALVVDGPGVSSVCVVSATSVGVVPRVVESVLKYWKPSGGLPRLGLMLDADEVDKSAAAQAAAMWPGGAVSLRPLLPDGCKDVREAAAVWDAYYTQRQKQWTVEVGAILGKMLSRPMSLISHRMGAGEVPAFWDKTTPQGVHKKGATNARRQEP